MAEAVALVASPIIEKFIQESMAYLGTDLTKELDDLQTTILPQLELVIKAAENSPPKLNLANWLRRLKEAYYNAEDILDELEYERLELECNRLNSEINNKKRKFLDATCSHPIVKRIANFSPIAKVVNTVSLLSPPIAKVVNTVSLLSPTKRKLWGQLNELKEIAAEGKTFYELLRIQPENSLANQITHASKGCRPSSSLMLNKVLGRDKDRDDAINFLMVEPIGKSNLANAIVGIGGAGKTTLAQYILNDPRVVKHFDVRIWVCLSPKLDIIKHTKEMIESASSECVQRLSFDALQRDLNDIVFSSKKTLLVLDDICYSGQDEEEEWSQFLAPFTSHIAKHKILLTSRSKSLPKALGPINFVNFKDLEEDEFKLLFRHFAFDDAESWQKKELEEIGDKIAKKLSRSPLAAKAVASRLSRNLDHREWTNTLDNVNLSTVSDSLLWTYLRLDAQLQRCFLYCSIFPKGNRFHEFELVNLWLCENFIKCSEDTYDVKEKAMEYVYELIACSFLQPLGTIKISSFKYKIHDLFHDLAEKLSKEDCFRIEGSNIPREIPSTVRYISISLSHMKEEHISIISKSDQLRTVFFLEPFVNDVNDVFKQLLSKLKKLRVLVLFFYNNVQLPKLVGELKHLRYLETIWSSISEYPDSLCKLHHLQVLILNTSVKKLPRNLSNLKLLRHLEMFDSKGEHVGTLPPIANIGNLTSLETVGQFHVRKENGFELHQLGNLKRLKGVLRIENLENGNIVDAIEAKLSDKKDLERLELIWGNYRKLESDFDLELIEGLQPHANLKHLLLEKYGASRYPTWLLENSVIRNLYSLDLKGCMYLQLLPSNLTHCDKLTIASSLAFRDLSRLPERLTSLTIYCAPALAFAPKENTSFSNQHLSLSEAEFVKSLLPLINLSPQVILKLELIMLDCTPMPENYYYSEYNDYLQIYKNAIMVAQQLDENFLKAWWYCHQKRMDFVYKGNINAPEFILPSTLTTLVLSFCNITDGALSVYLLKLTSLNKLQIEGIMTLTTLPSEHVMRQLKNLKCLKISTCWCLRSLGFLAGLVYLETLEIFYCPCLDLKHTRDNTIFPESLKSLSLCLCVIPDGIFTSCVMPYLNTLKIERCRGSESLSIGMLTSLRLMCLSNCPDICKVKGLQSLPGLNELFLIKLPNFQAGSLMETPMGLGWQKLCISSLEMLKALSANNAFGSLEILLIKECQEETFTPEVLEVLARIPSLYHISFDECKIKDLPNSLKELSGLKYIRFKECPEISLVPELPESIRGIYIEKCPVLKERCRAPDGPDWPNIAHIPTKKID